MKMQKTNFYTRVIDHEWKFYTIFVQFIGRTLHIRRYTFLMIQKKLFNSNKRK